MTLADMYKAVSRIFDVYARYYNIITANVWNTMPFSVLVLLAALQAIPNELYDAAKVDGADAIGRFRFVTLPWLIHPILIVLIVQALGGIRIFEIIYLLTGGGPGNASTTLGFATYITSFVSTDIGRGNAWFKFTSVTTVRLSVISEINAPTSSGRPARLRTGSK